jgi:hypothetical protein
MRKEAREKAGSMSNEIIKLWFIKDSKGVSSILTTWDHAKTAIQRHRQYISDKRGTGQLKQVDVPSSDWYSSKVTTQTIERYPNAQSVCHV